MIVILAALLIGVIAGLRAMTALAAISWAAYLGWLPLHDTPIALIGTPIAVIILTILMIGELVTDQLPRTPSRKVLVQFGARLVIGTFCGAAIGLPANAWIAGLVAGVIGAIIGTLVGAAVRTWLAAAMGRDLPAALIEDVVAVGGAALLVAAAL
jgi:uncharacterized membrane protein